MTSIDLINLTEAANPTSIMLEGPCLSCLKNNDQGDQRHGVHGKTVRASVQVGWGRHPCRDPKFLLSRGMIEKTRHHPVPAVEALTQIIVEAMVALHTHNHWSRPRKWFVLQNGHEAVHKDDHYADRDDTRHFMYANLKSHHGIWRRK